MENRWKIKVMASKIEAMASKIDGKSIEKQSNGFTNQWKIVGKEAMASKIDGKSMGNLSDGLKNQRKNNRKSKQWLQNRLKIVGK